VLLSVLLFQFKRSNNEEEFVFYIANPKKQSVVMYLKDSHGNNYGSIANLKTALAKGKKEILFAMNGGMYKKDKSPQGLFISAGKMLYLLEVNEGAGNFYLKPNGIFYLDAKDNPVICKTEEFKDDGNIKYATQSGPMLLVDGQIHAAFREQSTNLNIRNGVGILPDNKVLFAMSKKEINFYQFAQFFKDKGCKNALYLDGFVSRMYNPKQNWIQTDGDFGVIIGITK